MGTYCTHYRKMALWVAYILIDGLETEACRYLFQLWGLGYSTSFLMGGGISDARIGRDGMATGIRYRQGLEVCKVAHISGGGTPLRGSGGAQEFRESM